MKSCPPSRLLNLYKIAPKDSGNPPSKLCKVQFQQCIELLCAELVAFRPKRLLVMTKLNWAQPFVERLMPQVREVAGYSYVEAVGNIGEGSAIRAAKSWSPVIRAEKKRTCLFVRLSARLPSSFEP